MNRHEVGRELAVNDPFRAQPRGLCDYPQLVSAALVTVRSSGSLVGWVLVLRSICRLTDEPLGGGALNEEKSGPSTT